MPHLVYERLKVKNSDIYGEADLDLAYQGITVIYGLNKDANHGSTNAAGKSRLFSYIPELRSTLHLWCPRGINGLAV